MENPALDKILEALGDDFDVSDEEYKAWKTCYENLPDHEKVFSLLGALSQYLLSGCRASAAILGTAMICTSRWTEEKSMEDF